MRVLLILVTLMFVLPLTALSGVAQTNQPIVANCDPANCDPRTLNGVPPIKTGDVNIKTLLYCHFLDIFNAAPLNTQEPDAEHEEDLNRGFTMPTVNTNTDTPADVTFKSNEFECRSSPGLVEYTAGETRGHTEPGFAADIVLSGEPIMAYAYFSSRAGPEGQGGQGVPGVMPSVGVYSRLESGRFAFLGDLYSEGDTGTGWDNAGSNGAGSTVTMYNQPGADQVYEFEVEMKTEVSVIGGGTEDGGFLLSFYPYQVQSDQAGGTSFTQAEWRMRTGPSYPWRMIIEHTEPVYSSHELVHTFRDHLYFRWSFNSPWGSYDVDPNSLLLTVSGPKELGTSDIEFVKLKYSVDHDGHFIPVNATWRYPYIDRPLPAGEYSVLAMVHNRQNTYMMQWRETFTVDENGVPDVQRIGSLGADLSEIVGQAQNSDGGGAPGPSPAILMVSLIFGLAVAAARRRP